MTDIVLNSKGEITFKVDLTIYSEAIIDKVLYWWSDRFAIMRKNIPQTTFQEIILVASYPVSPEELPVIRQKLSDDFIDYKNRSVIESETRDIRNILYAKVFAYCDDFVEFEFME